ncbi:MFS transporter [Roseisolibacter sp. H3M3-2]|uniref:MFS transporter n=1 Tax=Roseisolibacter sp. H3M3-2 TaxID=3031323 RepID=UPI0023DC8B65|nr:MFS transporter [Roseisolibacter sp. H3M3-2]MDF1501442.1 MFS transporter [Roseisolibacter sp. H3M3-2]
MTPASPASSPPAAPAPRPWLGRTVVTLALVSLLTDASSEMIAPLLPIFLTASLGASAAVVGAIEGAAETTAALLKLASGWWSDRLPRRKPLVLAGYLLASAARPLVAVAASPAHVLAVRLTDRVGKGIVRAPRVALLAGAAPAAARGRAFGFHRAADHLGAVIGPLLAWLLLSAAALPLRTVFWLAAVPGALAVLVLAVGVREEPRTPEPAAPASVVADAPAGMAAPRSRALRALLVAVFVFTLGNATDAFLVLRATQLGVPVALVPALWAALHAVKSLASTPGGALSDRLGRRPTIVAGWGVYALVYAGFAFARAPWHVWALMLAYGAFFGLTEGAEKALVADLSSHEARGAAFGWYHLVVGVAALPASLLFGALWDARGAPTAFLAGAGLAAAAAAILLAGTPPAQQQREPGFS